MLTHPSPSPRRYAASDQEALGLSQQRAVVWRSPTEQIDARFPQRFKGVARPRHPQTLQGVPYRVDGGAANGYGSTIYGQFVNYGECDPSGEPKSRLAGDGVLC